MLQKYGLRSEKCFEGWNISHPQVVQKIHQEYIKIGADVILTNTFGANRIKLSSFDRENNILKINEIAVNIAKRAINKEINSGKRIFIADFVGPTGKILESYGDLKVSEAYKSYKEQAVVLEKAGIDLIILETFYDFEKIRATLKAVKENIDLMVSALMIFDKNLKTIYGVDPKRAVIVLENKGTDGVGTNCGTGPEVLYKVLKIMKKESKTYLMVESNAGCLNWLKIK